MEAVTRGPRSVSPVPMRSFSAWLARLAVLLLTALSGLAYAFVPPPLSGAVNDAAGMLSPAERAKLEELLAAHRKAHGHEVVLFTVPSLGGESIEDVAYKTFNTWGVGKKGKDDGVLLVIAPTERKTRIESGKGVGGELTDLVSKRILSERVGPKLKVDKRYEALRDGVESIHSVLLGGPVDPPRDGGEEPDASPAPAPVRRVEPPSYPPTSLFVDGTESFPAELRAKYLAATEVQRKKGAPLLAVIVVPEAVSSDAPVVAGANSHAYYTTFPECRAILVVGRNGRNLYVYYDLASFSDPKAVALQSAASLAKGKVGSAPVDRRAAVLVDEAIALQEGLARVPADAWRSSQEPTLLGVLPWIGGILGAIVFLTWLFGKLGWTGGGGAGGGSSGGGSSSSSSGSSYTSSGSSGGAGYSGGGGSSGGGGASDSY